MVTIHHLGETPPIQNLLIGNLKMKFESMKKNSWVIFESYMAALLIEQPEVAKSFIRNISSNINGNDRNFTSRYNLSDLD